MKKTLLVFVGLDAIGNGASYSGSHGACDRSDSGTVLANQQILIVGGKIQAVGSELALPAEAKVIDLSKMTGWR